MAHQHLDELWVAVEKSRDAAAIALKKSIDDTTANMKMIIENGVVYDSNKKNFGIYERYTE